MLAGVTDCRRSQKWGCKGRWALGFKPRHGNHRGGGPRVVLEVNKRKDHAVLKHWREDHNILREKGEDDVALAE